MHPGQNLGGNEDHFAPVGVYFVEGCLEWELQDKRHSRPDPPTRCSMNLCSVHLHLRLVRHRVDVCDSF